MSFDALSMAWHAKDAPLEPGPMFVLVILADHGNDHDGEDFKAFPSVERIMQRSKYKRSAVEAHLKSLVTQGWVSRRRRTRPDGKKGVYDYTLHREPEFRARLRAARAALVEAGIKVSGEVEDLDHPCVKSTHGEAEPCVNSEETMREIHAWSPSEPCVKSTHHEPLLEPLDEPSAGARALRAKFDDLVGKLPKRVLKFSDLDEAWAWFQRVVEGGVSPETLIACAATMADDRDFKARRYVAPLEVWLSKGQWRGYLPEPELAFEDARVDAAQLPNGAAPAEDQAVWQQVRDRLAANMTEATFGSWIRPTYLAADGDQLFVVALGVTASDWIKRNAWRRVEQAWEACDPARRKLVLSTKSQFEAGLARQAEREA